MNTITERTEASIRERGSKFLGYVFPCSTEDEFGEELNGLRSRYPDANHHCYAYRIDPNNIREFSSDDGEPSGTAGLPILNQLKSFDLVNTGIVVVRYFGGTKLGKPGLIQAYGETAGDSLANATLKEIIPVQLFRVTFPYQQENVINKIRTTFELVETNATYTDKVELILACRTSLSKGLITELERVHHLGIDHVEMEETFIH